MQRIKLNASQTLHCKWLEYTQTMTVLMYMFDMTRRNQLIFILLHQLRKSQQPAFNSARTFSRRTVYRELSVLSEGSPQPPLSPRVTALLPLLCLNTCSHSHQGDHRHPTNQPAASVSETSCFWSTPEGKGRIFFLSIHLERKQVLSSHKQAISPQLCANAVSWSFILS